MTVTVIRWDPAAVEHTFRSPTGLVGRDTARRAALVFASARTLVHVSPPADPAAPPRNRQRGQLRNSITMKWEHSPLGPRYLVGSDDPAARVHELGSRPHDIYPRTSGGLLVFYWDRKQRLVGLPHVHHPGTRPVGYLRHSLPLAIVNHGQGR